MLILTNSTYLSQINKFPYLSQEEEYALAKRYIEYDDLDAAHQLIVSHLRYVVKIASKYKTYGLPFMDLVQEGTVGLMQAVKKFDPVNGARLATYATLWIKSQIQDYILCSWSLVKIGTTMAQKKLFYNLKKIRGQLNKFDNVQLERSDIALISTQLKVSEKDVIDMDSRLMQKDKSLNEPIIISGENNGELLDTIEDNMPTQDIIFFEDEIMRKRKKQFNIAFNLLNEREKDILKLRHLSYNPLTHEEIRKKFNVSRERVRQIENKAIEKIKNAMVNI